MKTRDKVTIKLYWLNSTKESPTDFDRTPGLGEGESF